jgi:hypothetical protein
MAPAVDRARTLSRRTTRGNRFPTAVTHSPAARIIQVMKCSIAVGLVLIVTSAALGATPPNQLTPEEKAAGFRLLFDGKTTDAWRAWDGEFPKRGWTVHDDCLVCEASNGRPNGGGGDIVTREAFTDFDFRWEWKISAGGNSGLIYFVHERDKPGKKLYDGDSGLTPYGHEYQLLDDSAKKYAKEPADRLAASFYDLIAPAGKKLRPQGQFNESRLVVRGNHVEHWLNGAKVVEYELGSPKVRALVKKSKYAGLAGFGEKSKTPLLIQDHGYAIALRNLKIRLLDGSAKP